MSITQALKMLRRSPDLVIASGLHVQEIYQ